MKRQELTMSERSEIAKRYLRHESTAEIGAVLGCSAETVRRILKADGIWLKEKAVLYDTQKQIRMCLQCKKDECTNCIDTKRRMCRKGDKLCEM